MENKSRLLHHTEWNVEETYFEQNRAELLKPYNHRFVRSWVYIAAAACTVGIGLFLGLRNNQDPVIAPTAVASVQKKIDTTPTVVPTPVVEEHTSKSQHTHTNQPVKQHVTTYSESIPADFEQALASISKEEIIDYLADEDDDSWYDTNTN